MSPYLKFLKDVGDLFIATTDPQRVWRPFCSGASALRHHAILAFSKLCFLGQPPLSVDLNIPHQYCPVKCDSCKMVVFCLWIAFKTTNNKNKPCHTPTASHPATTHPYRALYNLVSRSQQQSPSYTPTTPHLVQTQ